MKPKPLASCNATISPSTSILDPLLATSFHVSPITKFLFRCRRRYIFVNEDGRTVTNAVSNTVTSALQPPRLDTPAGPFTLGKHSRPRWVIDKEVMDGVTALYGQPQARRD